MPDVCTQVVPPLPRQVLPPLQRHSETNSSDASQWRCCAPQGVAVDAQSHPSLPRARRGALYSGCTGPQFAPPLADDDEFNKLFCTKSDGSCGVGKFARPEKGLYGFSVGTCTSGLPGKTCTEEETDFWALMFNFNIIDKVQIPKDLAPGDYVLSFRWDCEQTPKIWANCADVTIA